MSKIATLARSEPVALAKLVDATVLAVIVLGHAFTWWTWTPEQTAAVLGVVAAGMALATTAVRGLVTPLHTSVKDEPTEGTSLPKVA